MSDQPQNIDNRSTADDTAPIPTPGTQGASAPAAPVALDVPGAPSTPPADGAAKEPTSDDGGEPKKQGGGFQKRIAELTREREHERREKERLLGLLERQTGQPPKTQTHQEQQDDQPPKPSDFEKYEDYLDARADWRAEQRVKSILKDQGQQTQQRQTEEQFKAKVAEFNSTIVKEGKDIEGFAEAHAALTTPAEEGGPEVHPLMADFLMTEAENKALLVKYLGENPDEATKLSRLHPRTMINRLSRLDAKLGEKPPAKVSNAPTPPPVLNGNGSLAAPADLTKADIDIYAEQWHARRNRKR